MIQFETIPIDSLGEPRFDNPRYKQIPGGQVLLHCNTEEIMKFANQNKAVPVLEQAGPSPRLFFEPGKTRIGIVTCGGLCPGLNAIIRSIVYTAYHYYGLREIFGFKNGYRGLNPALEKEPVMLQPAMVDAILDVGGTILGTSRGPQDVSVMVDYLVAMKIDILFAVGGDGTLRGALEITGEIQKRGCKIGVIGIPKTIDNDIAFVERSFGFETAVEQAKRALISAHNEANSLARGIGLVKLMGRDSGFIASMATLATAVVNACLVPEVPFKLEGENGLFALLDQRLKRKNHAVIAVAEGAGQDLLGTGGATKDKSGNVLKKDIGIFLKDEISDFFKKSGNPVEVKYIDPSYLIRSVAPTADDSAFCLMLAQDAVHAGMAGRTNAAVAFRNDGFILLPFSMTSQPRKKIDPAGRLWETLLETTGQPAVIG